MLRERKAHLESSALTPTMRHPGKGGTVGTITVGGRQGSRMGAENGRDTERFQGRRVCHYTFVHTHGACHTEGEPQGDDHPGW